VIAAEAVPVGHYTREMLAKLSSQPGFGSKYGQQVLANVASYEENVKGVVAKVQLGEADAGVVYRSDATGSVASQLTTLEIPEAANVIASYPIAVVRGAASPNWPRRLSSWWNRHRAGVVEKGGFHGGATGGPALSMKLLRTIAVRALVGLAVGGLGFLLVLPVVALLIRTSPR
jgi:hypothetical protein